MEAVIKKWGNSPALRIPMVALREAGYHVDQKVELTVSKGTIVVQPCEQLEYTLSDLVDGINKANQHAEVDFGAPVGKEVW